MQVCGSFEYLARRTWRYVGAGQSTAVRIGEQTLTDINLVDLQLRHPNELCTHKFKPHEEVVNGADWEWWFRDGGSFLGARVQAKKLYFDAGYKELYGRKGRDQADHLVDNVGGTGITPLYCFYNCVEPGDSRDWPLLDRLPIRQMGCGIASAYAVQSALTTGTANLDVLAPLQRPWRWLVCPGQAGGGGGGGGGARGRGGLGPRGRVGSGSGGPSQGGGSRALEPIWSRLRELMPEKADAVPAILSEAEVPDYVWYVLESGKGSWDGDLVPARRVLVVDLGTQG